MYVPQQSNAILWEKNATIQIPETIMFVCFVALAKRTTGHRDWNIMCVTSAIKELKHQQALRNLTWVQSERHRFIRLEDEDTRMTRLYLSALYCGAFRWSLLRRNWLLRGRRFLKWEIIWSPLVAKTQSALFKDFLDSSNSTKWNHSKVALS